MNYRLFWSIGVVAVIALVVVTTARAINQVQTNTTVLQRAPAQNAAPAADTAAAPKTPWGEPDLQGIWSVELLVPLERPAGVTGEFYTAEEVAELDNLRAGYSVFGNHLRAEPGSEADVTGAYNAVYTSQRPTGQRTAMVVDPPDGRIPSVTSEAQQRATAYQEYKLALLQHTAVCRDSEPACQGGEYGPPSPRLAEDPPEYPAAGIAPINRADGPEDRGLSERCLFGNLPHVRGGFTGVFRRIVQSPGGVTIFYDAEQGQGFSRNIPITTSAAPAPERPPVVGGLARALGGRDAGRRCHELHRHDRDPGIAREPASRRALDPYRSGHARGNVSTMEDPTVWTQPWTVIQDFKMQDNEANRIYTEPRCHEGNFGMLGALAGARAVEQEYEAGSGRHPASLCIGTCGLNTDGLDPLALR